MKEKVKLGFNTQQMLRVLGAALYKGNVCTTAVRELVQNSFDAVKPLRKSEDINVEVDMYNNKITIVDNGIGMTPQIVRDVFLTIGGTNKELSAEESSGGFGIAKVQFFTCAEHIFVESTRGGICTTLDTNNIDLIEGRASLQTRPSIANSSTKVILTFPKYTEDGERINFSYYGVSDIYKRGFVGYPHISINLNNKKMRWNPTIPTLKHTYEWGDVEIFIERFSPNNCYCDYTVYSAGLPQFNHSTYLGSSLGSEGYINIRPRFTAGDNLYPFANNRDQFASIIKKDIESINEALKSLATTNKRMLMLKKLSNKTLLSYLDVESTAKTKILGSPQDYGDFKLPENMDLSNIEEFLKTWAEYIKRASEMSAMLKEDKESNKDSIVLINNTDSTVDMTAVSKIGSIVYDFIYDDRLIGVPHYKRCTIAGVIIDPTLGGICARSNDIRELYINPFAKAYKNANHFASKMMRALLHEYSHCLDSSDKDHSETFFECESILYDYVFNSDFYYEYYDKFVQVYMDNGDKYIL